MPGFLTWGSASFCESEEPGEAGYLGEEPGESGEEPRPGTDLL